MRGLAPLGVQVHILVEDGGRDELSRFVLDHDCVRSVFISCSPSASRSLSGYLSGCLQCSVYQIGPEFIAISLT